MARTYTAEQLEVLKKVATNEFDGFIKIDKIYDRQDPGVEKFIYARLCRVYDPNMDIDMISSLGGVTYRNGERVGLVFVPVRDGKTGSIVCENGQFPQDPQLLDARVIWEAVHGEGEVEAISKEIVSEYKGTDFDDRYYTVKDNGQEARVLDKEHCSFLTGPASVMYAAEIRQSDRERVSTPRFSDSQIAVEATSTYDPTTFTSSIANVQTE
ncbi:MAG: hypothetical protein IJW32_00325 [Clostridia bacterium]|nr:hypothetical protein [Clostridia bacterium]